MDKYLIELLKEMSTIIIPGLGALTINEEGVYSFSSDQRDDDGALARHIAEREGWSENDAKNLIAKYVRAIESKLNIGESYDMYRFGSFRKTSEGVIEFEAWKKRQVQKEQVKVANQVKEPAEETSTEDLDENNTETIEEPITEGELTLDTDDFSEQKEEPEPSEQEPPRTEPVGDVIEQEVYTEDQQWNDEVDLPPINASSERPIKPILEKVQRDKQKGGVPVRMIVMVVAVILVVTSIGIYLNNGKTIQKDAENTKSSEVEDDNSTAIAEVTPENKVLDTTELAMQATQKLNQTGVSSNPGVNGQGMESGETIKEPTGGDKFYLVLGCFYGRQMADSLCKKVKGDGFQALTSQSRKGFFFVSIGSYSTHQSASKALPAVKSVYSNVWIMKDI